jgi:hypothetical protein
MSDQGERPRDLVIYTLLVAGLVVASYSLYGLAGQKFTEWFVKDALPKIQAQTEDQFKTDSPFATNFDSSALQSGFGSSGGFSGSE